VVRTNKRVVGDAAEDLAYRYLKQRGLIPVRRNFACRLGELDLIMLDQQCLVIVEVRFRSSTSFVNAQLTIDYRKQRKIVRTTSMFLAWNKRFCEMPIRFDVVGVDTDESGETTINWISDAFRPAGNKL